MKRLGMKRLGIFVKVFIYTTLFSGLLVGVTAALFWQQFETYYSHYQIQSIVDSYQQLVERSRGDGDITGVAQRFYERNESFQFYITDKEGTIVYETPRASESDIVTGFPSDRNTSTIMVNLDRDHNLYALQRDVFSVDYGKWIARVVLILAAMLAACIIGSLFFARRLTKPIKTLADTTNKMANLEEVPLMPERGDELGALARDVHSMYSKLKDEILRERELEETQRYFFSAASHELKTPVAATSVLLEGMLANIGDYKDHPKYLRECLKLIDAQSETISEILEIVSLTDGKIVPAPEKLDIAHLVTETLPEFQTLAESSGQRIVVDVPDDRMVLADPKMLKNALSNVILNAIQNTPGGGEIRIWSERSAQASRLRLCVLNLGVQIDNAILLKLFDPFYRADKARSRKSVSKPAVGRSGLGLTIVQKTLESMNIEFALENTPDGVLFWLDLPEA
jgi:two-component system sensor histidine kinase VanS